MKVLYTKNENFELRPWGGRMCFLATTDSVDSELLGVTAVLRMGQKLTHSIHTHDDCDEVILVLDGQGRQLFVDEAGRETAYDLHPGDLLYIAKNRVHRTDNLSETGDLTLFIVNYFYHGQSDPGVKGLIPSGSEKEIPAPYGFYSPVISKSTCGNTTTSGEIVQLLPGKKIEYAVTAQEEFVFCIQGDARITAGTDTAAFPRYAQAYFTQGERYSVENISNAPVSLFCMRAE